MRRDRALEDRPAGAPAFSRGPLAAAALAGALLVALPRTAGAACQRFALGTSAGDQLGCSLLLREGSAFVGANAGGYVQVLGQQAGNGVRLTSPSGQAGDEFGFAVAAGNGWLAVGAPGEDGAPGADAGTVFLFRQDDGIWRSAGQLAADDASAGARFGSSLALAGDILLVGAPGDAERGSLAGAVYAFRLADRRQVQKLIAPGTRPFDSFGFAVAYDGERAAIGAPLHEGPGGTDSGAVSIWEESSGGFRFVAELTASDAAAGDQLGGAVALADGRVAAAARRHDAGGRRDAGAVYVFAPAGSFWVEEARLGGEGAGDEFGGAVALTPDRLLVGARLADAAGRDAGAAYLFARERSEDGAFRWQRIARFGGAAGEGLGQAVALDGEEPLSLVSALAVAQGRGAVEACLPDPPSAPSCLPGDLRLTLDDGTALAAPGQTLTYRLAVTNRCAQALAGVAVATTAPTALTDVRWCLGTAPGCPTPVAGNLATTISLPAGGTADFTATATVAPGAQGAFEHSAHAEAPGVLPATAADVDQIGASGVDLVVTQSVAGEPRAGQELTYAVTVTNLGGIPATGVVLELPVPAGLEPISLPSLPTASRSQSLLLPLPDLATRASTTVEVVFRVLEVCQPFLVSAPHASSREPDSHPRDNTSMRSTPLKPLQDLAVVAATGTPKAVPGGPVELEFVVHNRGCKVDGVRAHFSLPPKLEYVRWCLDGGGPCTPGASLPEDPLFDLAAGASATLRLAGILVGMRESLETRLDVTGPKDFDDIHRENNSLFHTTPVGLAPGLRAYCSVTPAGEVHRNAGFFAGGTVVYSFILQNGGTAADAFAKLHFPVPTGITFSPPTPAFTWKESLPAGQWATVDVPAQIDGAAAGQTICAQAEAFLDADHDGVYEQSAPSDDLTLPGDADACCFTVESPATIPALSSFGLTGLAALLAALGLARLRRRSLPVGR